MYRVALGVYVTEKQYEDIMDATVSEMGDNGAQFWKTTCSDYLTEKYCLSIRILPRMPVNMQYFLGYTVLDGHLTKGDFIALQKEIKRYDHYGGFIESLRESEIDKIIGYPDNLNLTVLPN